MVELLGPISGPTHDNTSALLADLTAADPRD